MKRYFGFIILTLSILLSSISITYGDSRDEKYIDEIVKAMSNGNAQELAKYFNNTLGLSIPNNDGTYSSTQAEMILKDFFYKNSCKSFVIKNKGNQKTDSFFIIGELTTVKDVYRVLIMIKDQNGKKFIQQLKIEK